MVDRFRVLVALGVAGLIWGAVGCGEKKEEPTAMEPTPMEKRAAFREYTRGMTDNAILLDSSIVDTHFVPHKPDLNGLGVQRITRIGDVLSVVGGTINYATNCRDDDLVEARLASVREFLAASGFDTDVITVQAGMARSAGMSAEESIERRATGVSGGSDGAAEPAPMMSGTN